MSDLELSMLFNTVWLSFAFFDTCDEYSEDLDEIYSA